MENYTEQLTELIPLALPLVIALVVMAVLLSLNSRAKRRFGRTWPNNTREIGLISNVLRWVIILIVFLLLLEAWNVPIGNLWTTVTTLIALVAIGFFAVWSILSHMTAALVLFLQRPFRNGDMLQLGDEEYSGKIIKTGLFYTVVEDTQGGRSQIPNNLLFQKRFRVFKSPSSTEG